MLVALHDGRTMRKGGPQAISERRRQASPIIGAGTARHGCRVAAVSGDTAVGCQETNVRRTAQRPTSERKEAHAAMLEAALVRPGVREAMEVFDNWQEQDRRLDAWRVTEAALAKGRTFTTDRSLRPFAMTVIFRPEAPGIQQPTGGTTLSGSVQRAGRRSYSCTSRSEGRFHSADTARIIGSVRGRRRLSTSEARG